MNTVIMSLYFFSEQQNNNKINFDAVIIVIVLF
jgi:hypothetical protein